VIDLHCHVLPGLDDGPANFDFSLAIARAAAGTGTNVLVATPHIRDDYEVDVDSIEGRVRELNDAITAEGLQVLVLAGGEVSFDKAAELGDESLRTVCLGSSDLLLLESPYRAREVDIEGIVSDVQGRGFRAVLAHPERCPIFQRDPERLERLVDSGVLCSITSGSLAGRFGQTVKRFTLGLFADGLVHDVASDAHDHVHRPPDLLAGFASAESDLPGIGSQAAWFTVTAPVAMLAGRPLPARPDAPTRAPASRWRRLVGRL
jgi:protein-tyrosine phosphatase